MFKIRSEKKDVDGIYEKFVDHKPPNGDVQNKEGIRQNLIFPVFNEAEKSLSEVHRLKKCFLAEIKKALQPTKTIPPPLYVSMVRPVHVAHTCSLLSNLAWLREDV